MYLWTFEPRGGPEVPTARPGVYVGVGVGRERQRPVGLRSGGTREKHERHQPGAPRDAGPRRARRLADMRHVPHQPQLYWPQFAGSVPTRPLRPRHS